jgi:hypothetical protein
MGPSRGCLERGHFERAYSAGLAAGKNAFGFGFGKKEIGGLEARANEHERRRIRRRTCLVSRVFFYERLPDDESAKCPRF